MVYQLHKQCVKLKISLYEEPIALVSPLEAMAAIGMLYQSYGLPRPVRPGDMKLLRETALRDFEGRQAADKETEKILKLVRNFQSDKEITDDFWETLCCGYLG